MNCQPTAFDMTIIKGVGTKESQDSKLGISFTREGPESPLIIKGIKEDSVFADSDLRAGMIVHAVMGQSMTWETPKDAADFLRLADAGEVTLEASAYVAEIVKSDKAAKLGISLKNSTTKPGIFIANISDTGAFGGSELAPDQKVLYINDIPCPPNVKEAIALVKDAESVLKIVTIPTELVKPSNRTGADNDYAEEKKEETMDQERVLETDDKDVEAGAEKGIIDKIFATCIC